MVDDRDIARGTVQCRKAMELARANLKPGDRVIAKRCGGKISRFTFSHFSPIGLVMGVKGGNFAPICITSINGKRTHYERLPVTEAEMRAELSVIADRRAKSKTLPVIQGKAKSRGTRAIRLDDEVPL